MSIQLRNTPAPRGEHPTGNPETMRPHLGTTKRLLAGGLILALAACGSSTPKPQRTTTPTPTAAAVSSPAWDKATLDACTNAMDSSDDPDGKHAEAARSSAELSDVPTLREIAAKYARGTDSDGIEMAHLYTAQSTIATWCIQHGLG